MEVLFHIKYKNMFQTDYRCDKLLQIFSVHIYSFSILFKNFIKELQKNTGTLA